MQSIFVISDLHLGGRPRGSANDAGPIGSQICNSYDKLFEFIDWLSSGEATVYFGDKVELVVNGDIVDFLLEDDFGSDVHNKGS